MKSAQPEINCILPGGRLLMKCRSLPSRQWLMVKSELQGLAWLWLVTACTHSHTSRSLQHHPIGAGDLDEVGAGAADRGGADKQRRRQLN
jgi:hypothetical protein